MESLEGARQRVTAVCGRTLEETRLVTGEKLGFQEPWACRLFNRHGAEIDDLELLEDDDLVYAACGTDSPATMMRNQQGRPPITPA